MSSADLLNPDGGVAVAIEMTTRDVSDSFFLKDPDVTDALTMWRRGFYSDAEMLDKLKFQSGLANHHAHRDVLERVARAESYPDEHEEGGIGA